MGAVNITVKRLAPGSAVRVETVTICLIIRNPVQVSEFLCLMELYQCFIGFV